MQWLLRMACAMALLCVGFAHQAPAFAKGALIPAELAAYVLPDGTTPVICVADPAPWSHGNDKAHVHGCEACRIQGALLMPAPGCDGGARLRFEATAAMVLSAVVFSRPPFSPSRGARAPPRSASLS
jgi:hypothetical protein